MRDGRWALTESQSEILVPRAASRMHASAGEMSERCVMEAVHHS